MARFEIKKIGTHVGIWDNETSLFACNGHTNTPGVSMESMDWMVDTLITHPERIKDFPSWTTQREEIVEQAGIERAKQKLKDLSTAARNGGKTFMVQEAFKDVMKELKIKDHTKGWLTADAPVDLEAFKKQGLEYLEKNFGGFRKGAPLCDVCGGAGIIPGAPLSAIQCPQCRGTGVADTRAPEVLSAPQMLDHGPLIHGLPDLGEEDSKMRALVAKLRMGGKGPGTPPPGEPLAIIHGYWWRHDEGGWWVWVEATGGVPHGGVWMSLKSR